MVHLQLIAGILGLLTYIPFFYFIYKDKDNQSWVTWTLWALIDIIVYISTTLESGNFWLALGYAPGAVSIAIFLFIKKRKACGSFEIIFEIITVFLVIICILIWIKAGNKAAILACIISIFVSSGPQILMAIKKPFNNALIIIYLIFGLADFLSFIGGRDWSIEERTYPGSQLIVGFLIIISTVTSRLIKKKNPKAEMN